jgi:3-dehydroquinate dehydratase/shikimate dehydrogenase
VKLATIANSPHDNVRMMRLVESAEIPTVGICMGDLGTPSRILCGRFGSPFTYSSFHHELLLAPGQLSFDQMKDLYHYDSIGHDTVVYGVIADPIGHSLSPLIHNTAMHQAGLNAVYVPFRVPAEHLDQFLADAPAWGIRGLSVTIPHKEAVLRKMTKFDPAVKGIGAANTIVFNDDGLIGYNTDYRAAIDSLERAIKHASHLHGESLERKTVLVLGSGGAARAVAYGLKKHNAEVVIAGRTSGRAKALADAIDCDVIDWNNRHGFSPDILVNCTPVGMHPNVDETPYDKLHLRPSMLVFDTVYNPENTLLIKEARAQSCTVVTGVEMFVRQASLQYKLFTGQDAPWDLMRDTLKRAIGPARM